MSSVLKVCVVGPPNTGKTFFSMLMAGQTPYSESYQATVGLRVQEIERNIAGRLVRVQLWDCAGGAQYSPFWDVLARGIDGIILFRGAHEASHEAVLEKLYIAFAQPAKLSISQCLCISVRLDQDASVVEMARKLARLPKAELDFSDPEAAERSFKRVLPTIDSMLASCLQKKDKRG